MLLWYLCPLTDCRLEWTLCETKQENFPCFLIRFVRSELPLAQWSVLTHNRRSARLTNRFTIITVIPRRFLSKSLANKKTNRVDFFVFGLYYGIFLNHVFNYLFYLFFNIIFHFLHIFSLLIINVYVGWTIQMPFLASKPYHRDFRGSSFVWFRVIPFYVNSRALSKA